jgi:hypothetical protein
MNQECIFVDPPCIIVNDVGYPLMAHSIDLRCKIMLRKQNKSLMHLNVPEKSGGIIIAETEKRNFALRDDQGNEIGVYSGKSPRQAALKAANRGHKEIRLRERGTKKVHVFTGARVQVKKPKGAPAWMPDKIWRPKVKKVGVVKLETL